MREKHLPPRGSKTSTTENLPIHHKTNLTFHKSKIPSKPRLRLPSRTSSQESSNDNNRLPLQSISSTTTRRLKSITSYESKVNLVHNKARAVRLLQAIKSSTEHSSTEEVKQEVKQEVNTSITRQYKPRKTRSSSESIPSQNTLQREDDENKHLNQSVSV